MRLSRLCVVLCGALISCSETGPTTPDPDPGTGDSPSIGITASASTVTIAQAGSADVVLVLARAGGFAGEIQLSTSNVPQGVTASLVPATVPVGGSASALTLSVGGSVPAGSYNIEVRANGSGVTQKTVTITLTVTAVTTPGFTMTVAPSSVTLAQGSASSSAVSIARTGGFTGQVNLSVTGAPGGVNATLAPSFILVDPATLSIGATFNAPLGTHSLTVTATANGVPQRTATVTVQVTPSNPTGQVVWQTCPAAGIPVWFAYQDGAGPWTRVTGINDIYAFDFVSPRGGVAWAVPSATGGFDLTVFYATREELAARGQDICAGSRTGRTVHGTVAGLGVSDQAWISFGGASTVVSPAAGSAFTLNNVLAGTFDLMASSISAGGGGALTLNKLILRRGLDPSNGGSLATVDFGGTEAFNAVGQTVTVNNAGSDQTRVVMAYHAGGRRLAAYFADPFAVAAAVRTYPGVPAGRQVPGDLHVLNLIVPVIFSRKIGPVCASVALYSHTV